MRRDVAEQKANADRAWDEIVWPSMRAIGWWGPDPQCYAADEQDSQLAQVLDVLGGVDKLIKPNGHVLPFGIRIHFASQFSGVRRPDVGTRPWLTVRYRLKGGAPTEFDKMAHVAVWCFQAYVAASRRTVTRVFECRSEDVFKAISSRDLDLQEVQGGNVMARCHLDWLIKDGAEIRQYQDIEEAHRVNDPTVDNLIRHYGERGQAAYTSPGWF